MRIFLIIFGLIVATVGGVIAYRAWAIDPRTSVVISESGIREIPSYARIVGGLAMLVIGAAAAFLAARRRRV
jgi:hypothetical protein